ncbi:MAG: fibronectin type III domain-containing protein [Acidobacteriota bacterium]|nr:fibronectin type III domain-containing protein [Acidobacteriota bacterium]
MNQFENIVTKSAFLLTGAAKPLGALAKCGVVLTTLALLVGTASADYVATPKSSTWSPTDGPVYAIERIGNTIYIGGGFTTLRSPDGSQMVQRSRLAAFDATTGALLSWNPGANRNVRALQQSSDGTGLFVGGQFTNIAGVSRRGFAEINTLTGALVGSFNTKVGGGNVYAIDRSGTEVFIGGDFSTVNGEAHVRVAAVDETTGATVRGWNGSADGTVKSVLASEDGSGRLFVGGEFRNLSGQSRNFIGAFNSGDGSVSSWAPPGPCTDLENACYVLDLAQDNSKVYAAVGGPGGRVTAYTLSSGFRQWAAYGDGNVQAVAVNGGTVYVGGHFGPNFGGQLRTGFVALSAVTGGVLNYAPRFYGGESVFRVVADNHALLIGGGFIRLDSDSTRQRHAEFRSIASVNDTTPPSVPRNLRATNVSDTIATFYWDASTDDLSGVAGYRLLRDGVAVVRPNVTSYTDWDVLPSTTYTYQVQAMDAAGNYSALSAPLTIKTQRPSNALVHVGSTWKYRSSGGDEGTAWRAPAFDDSFWSSGLAQLGYGESDESTFISPKGVTSYFRKKFNVSDPSGITALTLRLLRDDGAVVYLNGKEVWRSNMPSTAIDYLTLATYEVKGAEEQAFFEQSLPVSLLNQGTNTFAVEVHQHSTRKPMDLSFDLELVPTF